MAATISFTAAFSATGTYNSGASGSGRVDNFAVGSNSFIVPNVTLSYGTDTVLDSAGAIPCNDWYDEIRTVTATSNISITLNGGADTNPFGTALAFTKIKYVLIAIITTPTGIIFANVGPTNVSNTAQLWFGGTGATAYEQVYWRAEHAGPAAGWTTNSTTASIFYIANPGGASLSVGVFIAGTKP